MSSPVRAAAAVAMPCYRHTMSATVLLERDDQLDTLRSLRMQAASGRGAMVFVGGEAGIGKSALVRRFCERSAGSAMVLVGGCDAMQTPRPLGPLQDMAANLGPAFTQRGVGAGSPVVQGGEG